ncbi:MAG: ABC transporter permease [Candidatus Latescibacteria bacterium]|nr:ABC transporter permease [Candidatus Latescibacterota bacterium]
MITIITRELMENLKDFRFALLLIFSLILFLLNGMIFPEKYISSKKGFDASINRTYFNPNLTSIEIFQKPSPFNFMAEGGDVYRSRHWDVRHFGSIRPRVNSPNRDDRLPDIPEPDWVFIIKIVFSLYIILMGYNAISGEKEQGTLALTLSNPITRIKLLLAKYCALMITVFVPLLYGLVLNIIIVSNSVPEIVSHTSSVQLIMMFLVICVYLSVFAFLSLLFSSLIKQSSMSLLFLMVFWIIFTISGDIAGIVSGKIAHIPSEMDIAEQHKYFDFTEYYDEFRRKVERDDFSSKEELLHEGKQLFISLQKNTNKHIDDYTQSILQRKKMTRFLSKFSPMTLFQNTAECVAGTGLKNEEKFINNALSYAIIYDSYVKEKLGELPVAFDYIGGKFTVDYDGEKVLVESPRRQQYDVDLDDFPVFQESKISLRSIVRDSFIDLSGLLFWNIGLAISLLTAFLRVDVR